ncbi:MAG: FeoB-associated Cys-rich membrane protein [Clostridia bacterium]|nr:FeoB-associated Cys-rich membrane protein [Clostridia bacterium]
MGNIIATVIVVAILGAAIAYIVKAKKSGKKCIGCPDGCCTATKKEASCSGTCSCCCGCPSQEKSE